MSRTLRSVCVEAPVLAHGGRHLLPDLLEERLELAHAFAIRHGTVARDHAVVALHRQHAVERADPLLDAAAGLEIDVRVAVVEEQIAEMEDAVLDEEYHQIAARVAAPQVARTQRLAAERDLVGRVEGLVGERLGGGAAPVAGVEGVDQFARALRRDDARAAGKPGFPWVWSPW